MSGDQPNFVFIMTDSQGAWASVSATMVITPPTSASGTSRARTISTPASAPTAGMTTTGSTAAATSDHGQFEGAHGLLGKGVAMYEESARIPLLVRAPDGARAGTVNRAPVSHIDILPTMLALAGIDVPPLLEGQSLVPEVTQGQQRHDREVVIEWNRADQDVHNAAGGFYPARCIIRGQHKLVVNLFDTDELYDLAADPHEMENRIMDPALASLRDRLHDDILRWMNETRDPFRGAAWLDRPWHHAAPSLLVGRKVRGDDGYLPPTLDYGTGRPERELHAG